MEPEVIPQYQRHLNYPISAGQKNFLTKYLMVHQDFDLDKEQPARVINGYPSSQVP